MSDAPTSHYDAIVIGAGFGGLYAALRLRDGLGLSVRGFDGASGVGGTWWHNRYPGARVDAPSAPFYGYTFSRELVDEWDWTETQSSSSDVLRYLEHVADRFDLHKDFEFDTRVTGARWDDTTQRWTIDTGRGTRASARFLICATGALFVANRPDYPGIDDFAGPIHHTGRWPHEPVAFEGKRVAVIGTGSSGVQAIPEIAKTAAHVTVFQRTAQYALPARNRPLAPEELQAYRDDWENLRESMVRRGGWPFPTTRQLASDHTPAERRARYEELWAQGGIHLSINSYVGVLTDEELNREVGDFVRDKIREIVRDPDTARKLTPEYLFGTKRLILDNGYFETYNRDNVTLVDLREDPITSFTATSVRTEGGEHPVDMLVLATGFDAVSGSMLQLDPQGVDGVRLRDKWATRFDTNLGMSVAGFPNLFMIHGPQSPGVLYTMPLGGERHVAWIESVIRHLEEHGFGAIDTTEEAEAAWDDEVNALANRTLYPRTNSWYTGANIPGKPRQFLAHTMGSRYFDRIDAIAADGFPGFVFTPQRTADHPTPATR
jgi:cation diffusion facilitator CzcD-associated flavoprotein CzcO